MALDRIQRHLKKLANLCGVQVLLVSQHDNSAWMRWQLTDQHTQPVGKQVIDCIALINQREYIVARGRWWSAAQLINGTMHRDTPQPVPRMSAGVQRSNSLVQLHEHFLRQVFGRLPISQHP